MIDIHTDGQGRYRPFVLDQPAQLGARRLAAFERVGRLTRKLEEAKVILALVTAEAEYRKEKK